MMIFKLINKMLENKYINIWKMFYTHMVAVIIFAILYYFVSIYLTHNNISHTLKSFYDCFYLSLITQSTLGYDNIILEDHSIKNIHILQMMSIFILIPVI
jgi:hypothetical protein